MHIELFGRKKCNKCKEFQEFLKDNNLPYIYRDMELKEVQDLYIANDYHDTLNNVIPIILVDDLTFVDVSTATKYIRFLLEKEDG